MKNNENLSSYAVEKRIGEGAFAVVYRFFLLILDF